jgi:hypothetical protein
MTTATTTRWHLKGKGYEFCNCDPGCTCNFGGFPSSEDGSCRAFVGLHITQGKCGSVSLAGVKCAAVYAWPRAIHDGNGKVAFIVDPKTTDRQVECLSQIFTGKLGGMPWELLGPTAEVVGLTRAKITIEGKGRKSTFRAEGIGEGRGDTLKNPVTGEDHLVDIHLPKGFIWRDGQCGQGSFRASAGGVSVGADKTNWIFYEFGWSNGKART